MSFSKIDFLEQIKKLLISSNIKNVVLFNSEKKTQFPLVVIDYGAIRNITSTIDSSRKIKYIDLPIIIEIYVKDKDKERKCFEIEQNIINCIQNSELKNLQLDTSMQVPNLDKTIYRWRISYNATINYENNGII